MQRIGYNMAKESWEKMPLLLSLLYLVCLPFWAHATVYRWADKGTLYLTNLPEEVPQAYKEKALTFTSKLAGKLETAPPKPIRPEKDLTPPEARMAVELARTLLESVPDRPPPRTVIYGPTLIIRQSPYAWAPYVGYGFIGPYVPYPYFFRSYPYGFGYGRFPPHSHFFPSAHNPRNRLFFPYGHSSHRGFLMGHGFFVE